MKASKTNKFVMEGTEGIEVKRSGQWVPISGTGLKAPGVVLLQLLFILLIETLEYSIGKVGLFTGVSIWIAIAGGLYLGRSGTEFANAVNPPLAFLAATILILCTIGGVGLHVARLGLDLVSILGSVAFYLTTGAIASWGFYGYKNYQIRAASRSTSTKDS